MLYCEHPFIVKSDDGKMYEVGCGHCPACLKTKRGSWTQRLTAEWVHSVCTKFVTLTYDDASLIGVKTELNKDVEVSSKVTFIDETPYFGVSKRDCQLFFKRLRKQFTEVLGHFKYWLVSEFGDKTGRPHYHVLMFFDRYISDAELSSMILKTWRYGTIIDVQDLKSSGGIHYLTDYLYKQLDQDYAEDKMYEYYLAHRDDMSSVLDYQDEMRSRPKTFMLSSRRPAIGMSYLKSDKTVVYHRKSLLNCYLNLPNVPQNIPLCGYLRKKIYTKEECEKITDTMLKQEGIAKDKFMIEHNMTDFEYKEYKKSLIKQYNYNLLHAKKK